MSALPAGSPLTEWPRWWDDQPPAVRAILDLAWMRDVDPGRESDLPHDRVLALLVPGHAETITDIARELWTVARLREGDASVVLEPHERIVGDTRAFCEDAADRGEHDILLRAHMIASLIAAGVR